MAGHGTKRRLDRMNRRGASREARALLETILRRSAMGEIRVKARLEKEGAAERGRKKPRVLEIDAVVDTGAVMMLLPQDMAEALGLRILNRVVVQLANDQKIELPRAGGILLTVADRQMITDCLVGPPGCEPLIGQIVMESLDLIADPAKRTLTPRPESPYLPTLKMKSLCCAVGG
jgi:predicted aspartyl protease